MCFGLLLVYVRRKRIFFDINRMGVSNTCTCIYCLYKTKTEIYPYICYKYIKANKYKQTFMFLLDGHLFAQIFASSKPAFKLDPAGNITHMNKSDLFLSMVLRRVRY